MQLVLHTGAHFTEHERLIKTVLRNKESLAKRGVIVPGPHSYRSIVRDTLNAMHKSPASPQAREVLLDVILDGTPAQRVILSDANFFRTPGTAIQKGVLYPAAAMRLRHMAELFPQDDVEIFLAIRNPAALIPLFHDHAVNQEPAAFWADRQAEDIRWSDTIENIRAAVPDAAMTVWCAEDSPLLWGKVARAMMGADPREEINGEFDLIERIMTEEGTGRLRDYIKTHPEMPEMQKHRAIEAFLAKFALPEELEEEADMPGWSEDRIDSLTALYDEDVELVKQIPGITFLTP